MNTGQAVLRNFYGIKSPQAKASGLFVSFIPNKYFQEIRRHVVR
jgi:hypothetical protein